MGKAIQSIRRCVGQSLGQNLGQSQGQILTGLAKLSMPPQ